MSTYLCFHLTCNLFHVCIAQNKIAKDKHLSLRNNIKSKHCHSLQTSNHYLPHLASLQSWVNGLPHNVIASTPKAQKFVSYPTCLVHNYLQNYGPLEPSLFWNYICHPIGQFSNYNAYNRSSHTCLENPSLHFLSIDSLCQVSWVLSCTLVEKM